MIHLVVALPAEARGLVRGLGLRRLAPGDSPLRVFGRRGLRLVVTGPGRERARRAVESIAADSSPSEPRGWLNVGIAGHRYLASGTCLLAEEIWESATGQRWRPTFPYQSGLPRITVCTVDRPETGFVTDAAYDMEASGFFAAASPLVRSGLVQVCKVVSDNRGDDLTRLTVERVENLMLEASVSVSEVIRLLEADTSATKS